MEKLLRGVEIFSAGVQTDSAGFTSDFTVEDLDSIVGHFNTGDPEFVPVKLGHTSDEFNELVASKLQVPSEALHGENGGQDGVVSLGRVIGLRRVQDKLVADFEVPGEMADLVDRGFLRDVSVEMAGEAGNWTLTAVAWLGSELPAVKDLNGLAAAASLRQRTAGPVLAFKQSVVVPDQGEELKMSLKQSLENLFKDADDAEVKSLFQEDDDDEDEDEFQDDEDTIVASPIGGEVAAAIRAMAGCDINCSDEELLDALRNLAGLPSSAPPEEVVPVMKARMARKPVAFKDSSEFKTMTGEIADLKRKDRVSHYRNETRGLLIQGSDEDLAEKLTAFEEKNGEEAATELLGSWKRESDATKMYTKSIGSSGQVEDETEYDFEERAKKIAEEQGISFAEAKSQLALEDGEAWHAYRSAKAESNS